MILHQEGSIKIFFGDARHKFFPTQLKQNKELLEEKRLVEQEPFKEIAQLISSVHLIFLHQVHGTEGLVISDSADIPSHAFSYPGDFLITQRSSLGLALAAADCLPIIFYDPYNNVIAIAHAGWRGSVAGVAHKTLEKMRTIYGTSPQDLKIFFGPSAKKCCYRVGEELQQSVVAHDYGASTLSWPLTKGDMTFFDLPLFNQLQLMECGVPSSAFITDYNLCTICDLSFCSYRRQQQEGSRQITVVTIQY